MRKMSQNLMCRRAQSATHQIFILRIHPLLIRLLICVPFKGRKTDFVNKKYMKSKNSEKKSKKSGPEKNVFWPNFSSHFHKIKVFYLHPPLPRFNVGFGAMLCLVLHSIYCIRTCRKSTFALVTQPSSVYSNIDWGGRGGGVIVNLCYISAATCKVSLTHSRAIVSYHLQKKRARLDARFSSFFHVFCIVSYVRMHHFKDFNHPPLVGRLRFYMFRYRVRVSVNVFCFTVDVSPTVYSSIIY